jgi:hypothetical protein
MEPTLTQNCALYYAQHKTSKGRATLFKKFRAAARKREPDVRRQLTFGELFIAPRLHKDNGRWAASLIALMDPLTFASSQKEESDFAAERRWENEGGNPGQLQQLPCDDRKESATTGPAQGALKAFRYKVNRTCT